MDQRASSVTIYWEIGDGPPDDSVDGSRSFDTARAAAAFVRDELLPGLAEFMLPGKLDRDDPRGLETLFEESEKEEPECGDDVRLLRECRAHAEKVCTDQDADNTLEELEHILRLCGERWNGERSGPWFAGGLERGDF